MPDDGAVAVAEAPVVESGAEDTSFVDTPAVEKQEPAQQEEKQDGRKQPDALRKRIADLKRQAESVVDPAEKERLLSDAKELNNRVGKVAAYEQQFPTVREARETKALVESFGGRDGLANLQSTLSNIQQIDQQLEVGDPAVGKRMWDEAPQGMTKLAPIIFSELEQRNPQEYEKAVVPHAIKFLDKSGFPEAFDRMVQLYRDGNTKDAETLRGELAGWVASQRQAGNGETRVDPRVEQLQREIQERDSKASVEATNRAYNDVVSHAAPVIDKHLKPIVSKLGLSTEAYNDLRSDVWNYLQDTRNADPTYKTVANAKYAQGVEAATAYVKQQTEERAQEAARTIANRRYGHQLKNGAVRTPNVTQTPVTNGVTRGKEPTPAEIDYSPKGVQVAKKQGYKDLSDMILAGKAPLKAGGIRQWR